MLNTITIARQLDHNEDHAAIMAAAKAEAFTQWLTRIETGISYSVKYTEEMRGPEVYEVATSAGTFIARLEWYIVMDAFLVGS